MKKSKLIKLLSKIKGDPEIFLWNGYVDDHMDIATRLVPATLVKHSRRYYDLDQTCSKEQKDRLYADQEWSHPNPFLSEEEYKVWYDREQTVYLIDAKRRNKSTWDRGGTVHY